MTKEIFTEKLKRLRRLNRLGEFQTNNGGAYNIHLQSQIEKVCKKISTCLRLCDDINFASYIWETYKLNMHHTKKSSPDNYARKIAFMNMIL